MYRCGICKHDCKGTLTISIGGRSYEACASCVRRNDDGGSFRVAVALGGVIARIRQAAA